MDTASFSPGDHMSTTLTATCPEASKAGTMEMDRPLELYHARLTNLLHLLEPRLRPRAECDHHPRVFYIHQDPPSPSSSDSSSTLPSSPDIRQRRRSPRLRANRSRSRSDSRVSRSADSPRVARRALPLRLKRSPSSSCSPEVARGNSPSVHVADGRGHI